MPMAYSAPVPSADRLAEIRTEGVVLSGYSIALLPVAGGKGIACRIEQEERGRARIARDIFEIDIRCVDGVRAIGPRENAAHRIRLRDDLRQIVEALDGREQ